MALREQPRTKAEELAFYKAHYHLRELLTKKANLMQQITQVDGEIGKYLVDIKPYVSWDDIAGMLNIRSGHMAKKFFEDVMGVEDADNG